MVDRYLLLAFDVQHEPIPKGRPRFSKKNNKSYTPDRTKNYEKLVSAAVPQAAFGARHASSLPVGPSVPIEVVMTFYLHRPKRLMRKSDPDGPILHTGRPDLDNLIKTLIDGVDRSGMVWDDDSQVCHKLGFKYYHAKSEKPHTLVQIYKLVDDGKE